MPPGIRRDLGWVFLAFLLLIAAGYGLRDPWPADEPRFAAVARDMVASGDWLFPRAGGDLYQDKPPVHFWLLSLALALIGSVRASFLLPSMLAALGTLLLVYDLGRRLHGRAAGLAAALTLACSVQFVMTLRGAQIDATLVFVSTLALWALLRHVLLGPDWRLCALGAFAAGVGVITKGVGFLPLLALPIALVLGRRGWAGLALPAPGLGGWRWWCVPAAFLLAVGCWLLPMLVAVEWRGDPALAAYRDEILFKQTVTRYAQAWHHVRPWYYFLVEVVPPLWLPLSALLFWLVPRWHRDWQARRAAVWVPLLWVVAVLVFFSLSTGKRGVYVLPALPALAIAAAPHLAELYARRGPGRLSLALAAVLLLPALVLAIGDLVGLAAARDLLQAPEPLPRLPIWAFVVAGSAAWLAAMRWRPVLAWPAVLACLTLAWGIGGAPALNGQRSGADFIRAVQSQVPADRELGLLAYKEQFLLYLERPTVNFGHARWKEGPAEAFDAARWLDGGSDRRVLLVPDSRLDPCFRASPRQLAGTSSRERWWLVGAPADPGCVRQGSGARVIEYPDPSE
jgi:4-amino-4-deoxy-L-arabinose transferase-like glycosyltransferase